MMVWSDVLVRRVPVVLAWPAVLVGRASVACHAGLPCPCLPCSRERLGIRFLPAARAPCMDAWKSKCREPQTPLLSEAFCSESLTSVSVDDVGINIRRGLNVRGRLQP
eukprot:1659167-Pyramimonas_sp.AAC.1